MDNVLTFMQKQQWQRFRLHGVGSHEKAVCANKILWRKTFYAQTIPFPLSSSFAKSYVAVALAASRSKLPYCIVQGVKNP